MHAIAASCVQACEDDRRLAEARSVAQERRIEHLQMALADAEARAVQVLHRHGELAAAYHPLVHRLRAAEDSAGDAKQAVAASLAERDKITQRLKDLQDRGDAASAAAVHELQQSSLQQTAQVLPRLAIGRSMNCSNGQRVVPPPLLLHVQPRAASVLYPTAV
jgi:hypothetical protein